MEREVEIDLTYLRMCREYARLTRCLSRKVGAMLVSPDGGPIAMGTNGPPRKIKHCQGEICPRKLAGDTSLDRCPAVHAEINALNACGLTNNSTKGCSLYIFPLGPCAGCAGELIQAKVEKIIFPESEWYDELGPDMLNQVGMEIRTYPIEMLDSLSCTD